MKKKKKKKKKKDEEEKWEDEFYGADLAAVEEEVDIPRYQGDYLSTMD